MAPRQPRLDGIVPFLVIALLNFVAYVRVATFPFFGDDYYSVQPLSKWRLLGLPSTHPPHWRPLWSLWVSIQYELFGASPGTMHSTNLALHVANACLAYVILTRVGASRAIALATVGLWSLMAGNAWAIAWISTSCDLLALTFLLAATYSWVFTTDGRPPSLARSAVATVCWFAAALTKEIGIAWPVAAVAFAWVRSRRSPDATSKRAANAVAAVLPIVGLVAYVGLRFAAHGGKAGLDDPTAQLHGASLPVVVVGRAIHFCEALLYGFLPLDQFPSWSGLVWGSVAAVAFIATLLIANRADLPGHRRAKLLAVGWVLLFSLHGALSPLPRTLYTATLGVAFLIVYSLTNDALFRRSQWAMLLFAAYLAMHVYAGQYTVDSYGPSNFAASVSDSRLLLQNDPQIISDMKGELRKELMYKDVAALALVPVESQPLWRTFLQQFFHLVFRSRVGRPAAGGEGAGRR